MNYQRPYKWILFNERKWWGIIPHFVYLLDERPLQYKTYIEIDKNYKEKFIRNNFRAFFNFIVPFNPIELKIDDCYIKCQEIPADPYQNKGILIQKRDVFFYGYGNPNNLLNKILIIS